MSRLYNLSVTTNNADPDLVRGVFLDEWGGEDESCYGDASSFTIYGESNLGGGETEEQAHQRISQAIKKLCPKAKVATRWTYLENLPFNQYGDEVKE